MDQHKSSMIYKLVTGQDQDLKINFIETATQAIDLFPKERLTTPVLASDGNLYPYTFTLEIVSGWPSAVRQTPLSIKKKSKSYPDGVKFNEIAVGKARVAINIELNPILRSLEQSWVARKQQSDIDSFTPAQKAVYLKILAFDKMTDKARVEYVFSHFKNSGIDLTRADSYDIDLGGFSESYKHGNHQEVFATKLDWHTMTAHHIHGYSN